MGYHQALPGIGWASFVPVGATNPTPIHVATVSGGSYSIKRTTVPLKNADGYVIDSFVAEESIAGKLTFSDWSNSLLSMAARGVTVAAGQKIGASHPATIPTTPFEITVTQGATFADNLGVMDLTAGKKMTRAATATGAGVYSVNTTTGVYTFNTADAGHQVLIMYRYTAAASGATGEIALSTASANTKFSIHIYQPRVTSKEWGFYVPAASINNLDVAFKKDGWSEVSLDWEAVADASNKLIYTYGPE